MKDLYDIKESKEGKETRLSIVFFAPKDTKVEIDAKFTSAINIQDISFLREPREPAIVKEPRSCLARLCCRR